MNRSGYFDFPELLEELKNLRVAIGYFAKFVNDEILASLLLLLD